VKDLELPDHFDLVVAGYLLNYAQTAAELQTMCRVISRCLKPGGRFVTVNNDPRQPAEYYSTTQKYGFIKLGTGAKREGEPVVYRILMDGSSFDITNYYLSEETHEAAFKSAGLRDLRWHAPQLSPDGEKEFAHAYWADFLDHPSITFLECVK
jgi:ubiquinone/menaquinone biosynthesis C-methylase UbiE